MEGGGGGDSLLLFLLINITLTLDIYIQQIATTVLKRKANGELRQRHTPPGFYQRGGGCIEFQNLGGSTRYAAFLLQLYPIRPDDFDIPYTPAVPAPSE